jgi:hypothetical protein
VVDDGRCCSSSFSSVTEALRNSEVPSESLLLLLLLLLLLMSTEKTGKRR